MHGLSTLKVRMRLGVAVRETRRSRRRCGRGRHGAVYGSKSAMVIESATVVVLT